MNKLQEFVAAMLTAFRILFWMSLVMMPLQVWRDSYNYLLQLSHKDHFIQKFMHSELKVISWINLLLSSLIFLMYPIGIGLMISLFFKGFDRDNIMNKMSFLFMVSYFGPVVLALLREAVTLTLLRYFKLEQIADNSDVAMKRLQNKTKIESL